jgi:hypothetical protein
MTPFRFESSALRHVALNGTYHHGSLAVLVGSFPVKDRSCVDLRWRACVRRARLLDAMKGARSRSSDLLVSLIAEQCGEFMS